MPTIADGGNATISVGVDDILTVQCPNGWVRYENPVGTIVAEFSGVRTFGPFSAAASVKVTSVQRQVYYEVDDLSSRATAATWADSSGSSIVRPDGSIAVIGGDPTPFTPYLPRTGTGSINPSKYTRSRAAFKALQAGLSSMKVGCIGDSTQAGAYALGNGTPVAGNRAVSHIAYFATAMNMAGVPAIDASFVGDQNVTLNAGTIATYDPRVTLGVGWGTSTVNTAGGFAIFNNSTVNALTFLPNEPVDTFDVYYATNNTGLGQFTVSRSGDTTSGVIDSNVAAGVGKLTFTGTLGNTAALSIQRNGTGAGVYIIAIDAYNSAEKSMRCLNIGWNGGKVSDWNTAVTAFDPLPAVKALACDFYILTTGVNEWNNAVPVATYQSTLDSYVASLLAVGDVMLATGYPSQNTSFTIGVQKPYIDAIYAVGAKYGLAINDVWRRVRNWERANSLGYYSNNLHPNKTLYEQKAYADAACVRAICGS